ncbi:3381_t:CDS:2, partial [Acaulospora morrowiae]
MYDAQDAVHIVCYWPFIGRFFLVSSPLQNSGDSQAQNNVEGEPHAQSDQDDSSEEDNKSLWEPTSKMAEFPTALYKGNILKSDK